MFIFQGGMSSSEELSPETMQQSMNKVDGLDRATGESRKICRQRTINVAEKCIEGKERVITDGPFAERKRGSWWLLYC